LKGLNDTPREIADVYLTQVNSKAGELRWAVDKVFDITFNQQWEALWEIILAISRREEEISSELLACVAAGPLEDLIKNAGPDFIDRIEHEAKFNHQFGRLLTGVWLYNVAPNVKDRITKFCRTFPNPIDAVYGF